MTCFRSLCLAAMIASAPALAGERISVALPDLSMLSEPDARRLVAALAQISVATSLCPDYAISKGEWTLLTGTGDMLAARLGIGSADYDRLFFGPAFEAVSAEGGCARLGPKARGLIDHLISLGGETTPLE